MWMQIASRLSRMSFYAVARGHKVGIYDTWPDCEEQVKGFKCAKYKKFKSRLEAEKFVDEYGERNLFGKKAPEANNLNRDVEVAMHVIGKYSRSETETSSRTEKKTLTDFWPQSDGDSFEENAVTDEELLNVMKELESGSSGSSTLTAQKRKATEQLSSGNAKYPKHTSTVQQIAEYKQIEGHKFACDKDGYVIVYTDGSCINNGRRDARAGFGVYWGADHQLNTAGPVTGRVTNNVGEIQAAIRAIESAKRLGIDKLSVYTDSQFLINAITSWIDVWKRKCWRLKNGEPVKNVIDFKILDSLLQDKKIQVKWNYVKGHAGIEGNDMADKLARKGADEYARLHSK